MFITNFIMFHHTYECGFEGKHEFNQMGKRFRCPLCGNIHEIPNQSTRVPDNGGREPSERSLGLIMRHWLDSFFQKLANWFKSQTLPIPERTGAFDAVTRQHTQIFASSKNKDILRDLATKAWKSSESLHITPFALDPGALLSLRFEDGLRRMMKHAARIAPGLEVPLYTPVLRHSNTPISTAGQFRVDEEGYTFIEVDNRFSLDMKASYAILSHELCHYILETSGIRETDTSENERLTDICMFVLGFGHVFLQGYKRELARSLYHSDYRIGYLSDDDYKELNAFVLKLRENGNLHLSSREEELTTKIINRLHGNHSQFERYLRYWEKTHPDLSHIDRLEGILYDLER
jgi:hypothetical protein